MKGAVTTTGFARYAAHEIVLSFPTCFVFSAEYNDRFVGAKGCACFPYLLDRCTNARGKRKGRDQHKKMWIRLVVMMQSVAEASHEQRLDERN
ncbi:MAG: hypothetical protein CM1200mP9_03810 [Gammaproteobacteria bacterium]|nr:MAG: hypothetical protein CM1200mP9_03810 [Gammaproteobacteria bacterium]